MHILQVTPALYDSTNRMTHSILSLVFLAHDLTLSNILDCICFQLSNRQERELEELKNQHKEERKNLEVEFQKVRIVFLCDLQVN